jgi:FkbM family methyltransferase
MVLPKDFATRARIKFLPKLLSRTLGQVSREDLEFIGTRYGGWYAPANLLSEDAVVYCVGCGEDITFDLGLIQRFGCHVWALDPTPRAIAHVGQHGQHPKYHFTPVGLWSSDTTMTFYLPDNAQHVSGSLVGLQGTTRAMEVPVRTLANVMADNGHDRIDMLKIDIEGAEYEVLSDMLASGIRPRAVLVEFDQPMPTKKTITQVRAMRQGGYDLVKVDHWNYVFVHRTTAAE